MRYASILLCVAGLWGLAHAGDALKLPMHEVNAQGGGALRGEVVITEGAYGLVIQPDLKGLPAGIHGFHFHENPSCAPMQKDGQWVAALAAGGHFDPEKTGTHAGPFGQGHLGDLPALYVDAEGRANYPVLAPRLKSLAQIKGRALMLHAGGDNHQDHPAPLGGGGARLVCGVVPI